MGRKAPYAFAATVALLATAAAPAAIVESNKITFTNAATPLNFDFTGQSELSFIKNNSKLVGIESYWTFTPGASQSAGEMDLLANLYSPSFASGVDTKVGFSTTIDPSQGTNQASSTYAAQKGLTFSGQVIASLLASGNNLPTELVGNGAGFSNLQTFFDNGGTAEGYLRLITLDPTGSGGGGGGGNDPVPEPASMLVWGALALGALAKKRSKAVAV